MEIEGTLTVYADRLPMLVSRLDHIAADLNVTYELGAERIVGSRGLFCRRYVSLLPITAEGTEYEIDAFQRLATVLARELCR